MAIDYFPFPVPDFLLDFLIPNSGLFKFSEDLQERLENLNEKQRESNLTPDEEDVMATVTTSQKELMWIQGGWHPPSNDAIES